jgi:hypothetical protein
MDSLLRQVMADADLERAYFYESIADKVWHMIVIENGRSRRGFWVA